MVKILRMDYQVSANVAATIRLTDISGREFSSQASRIRGPISETLYGRHGLGLTKKRSLPEEGLFTDEQIYFECYGMYCCEVLDFPLKLLHTKDMQRFKDGATGMYPRGVGSYPRDAFKRIEEFTQRTLGNPKDIFNGLLGILFETGPLHLRHHWAVPIIPSLSKSGRPSKLDAVGWPAANGLFPGLC